MIEIENLLKRKELKTIEEKFIIAKKQQRLNSFNLFSVSSYNTHYENFHSDIISKLLGADFEHDDYEFHFKSFLNFLNTLEGVSINSNDYENYEITREVGKIDIGIWGSSNKIKKCILIENKMNNADDMEIQILRYYNYANAENYEVELILYLSIDGYKRAPFFNEIKCPVINLAAFNNSESDLVNGWLKKSHDTIENLNSKSFLNEYIKLIKHLNGRAMENNAIEDFYTILNDDGMLDATTKIIDLKSQLPRYRMDNLISRIGVFHPFANSKRYYPNHHIFQDYYNGNNNHKMDFSFSDDGSAFLKFWIPKLEENNKKEANEIIKTKLMNLNSFDIFGDNHPDFVKKYKLGISSDEFKTMKDIDKKILEDIKQLLISLGNDK